MQLSSKNDDSSLYYDVIITIFRAISIITVGQADVVSLIIINQYIH